MDEHHGSERYVCMCGLEEEVGDVGEEEVEQTEITESVEKRFESRYALADSVTDYAQSRRIAELMNFLMAQLLAHTPEQPCVFLIKLLDSCMLARSGLGVPPILYDTRHIKQLVRSFDPGERGWLSAAQVRRARATVGLSSSSSRTSAIEQQVSTKSVELMIREDLNAQLMELLTAGSEREEIQDEG